MIDGKRRVLKQCNLNLRRNRNPTSAALVRKSSKDGKYVQTIGLHILTHACYSKCNIAVALASAQRDHCKDSVASGLIIKKCSADHGDHCSRRWREPSNAIDAVEELRLRCAFLSGSANQSFGTMMNVALILSFGLAKEDTRCMYVIYLGWRTETYTHTYVPRLSYGRCGRPRQMPQSRFLQHTFLQTGKRKISWPSGSCRKYCPLADPMPP